MSVTTTKPLVNSANTVADVDGVYLVFVPDWQTARFFLWGGAASESSLAILGDPGTATVVDQSLQVKEVAGYSLPLLLALRALAAISARELPLLAPSIAAWSLASKLLLDLVARERCVPRVISSDSGTEARWAVALSLSDDALRTTLLAKSFPLSAHAIPLAIPSMGGPTATTKKQRKQATRVWSSDDLLRAFLDVGADAVMRAALPVTRKRKARKLPDVPWSQRFAAALAQSSSEKHCAAFVPDGFAERGLLDELEAWSQPVLGATLGLPRVCFRFDLPDDRACPPREQFELRYFLQASDDPSVLVPASDVFSESPIVSTLHCSSRTAEEQLLKSLVSAGRIFSPIELSLRQARPDMVPLKPESAWHFINAAAPAIVEAGMGVILPTELTRSGQRRLRMRMRIGQRAATTRSESASEMTLNDVLLNFRWEVELNGQLLTASDLNELAAMKAPLVRYRGHWVAVDRNELKEAQKLLAEGGGTLTRAAALAAALGGVQHSTLSQAATHLPIEVAVDAELAQLLTQLNETSANDAVPTPKELRGVLRPYQQRGLAWLTMMSRVQLGACLADDMGLGKTIQLLAFLLHRREQLAEQGVNDSRPILLICPTSVLGNWQREIARFAPTIPVHAHYGPERARQVDELCAQASGGIVMTSYGLLRRDAALLTEIEWSIAVLDEAQNIKNASSRTARTARNLQAEFRVALTGTPVENRLTELWSIAEFLNPGMLGSYEGFRREIAIPIERFAREDVAERLKHIVRPLILRRVKSDASIIQDLPPKQEMTVYCTLTREQASLYQAELDAAMENIENADGIARRGQVLALITALKQICNHPAQYLREAGPLGGRSGKMERLREMLEEALAAGDRVLVFTQYREMGARLVSELTRHFGSSIQYLHGGTPRATRDVMIRRFQEQANGPRIFVLSLKAGGTGLNLTAATHVFHYDRWWNPAVEDQATDRAYRIGQQRKVQVHKFLCAGTIEERVNQMLEAKRDLAARIVGQGEQWITELNNDQLRELFSLAPNAFIGSEENGSDEADAEGESVSKPSARRKRSKSKDGMATKLPTADEFA
jgi:superfamily II DNA or RNA helicase